jgi:hypothetical protein
MFKLTAAIRSHFFVVPYIQAKAPSSQSPRQTFVPIVQGAGNLSRSPSVVVPKLLAASRTPLHPAEIEAMNASLGEHHPPLSTPSLRPDFALASLACKAPNLCSPLERMGRKTARGW